MTIKKLPKDERPRERLLSLGESALSISELITIILRQGSRGKSAYELSEKILFEIGEEKLSQTNVNQILKIEGIGKVRAVTLAAALELHRRLSAVKYMAKEKEKFSNPEKVGEFLRAKYGHEKQEIIGYILLNSKNFLLRIATPYRGTSNFAPVEPREIFGSAMVTNATKIILFHNHPSGDPNPSEEDLDFTFKMKDLGEKFQIPIIDHIIIGTDGWFSFAKEGKI